MRIVISNKSKNYHIYHKITWRLILGFFISMLIVSCKNNSSVSILEGSEEFNGQNAYNHIEYLTELGPRTINSKAHSETEIWIQNQLNDSGIKTEILSNNGTIPITNIIGKIGQGKPVILLGTHYDSRLLADKDPLIENRSKPVIGANDGASGTAILIELARLLAKMNSSSPIKGSIWIVFFDAEDNGNISNYDWILGSRLFQNQINEKPDMVVIIDMLGDKDLNIFQEKNSDGQLNQEIWEVAKLLNYEQYFVKDQKYSILDDHTPFLDAGIPAVLLIDFDYRYWHTTEDTIDKISSESLKIVGNTIFNWLQLKIK